MDQAKKADASVAKPLSQQSIAIQTAPVGDGALLGHSVPAPQVLSKYIDSRMKQFGSR